MRLIKLLRTIALVLLPILTYGQDATFTFNATDFDARAVLEDEISDYQIVEIDVNALYQKWKNSPGNIDFTLFGSAGEVELHLTPWELRSKDYVSTTPGNPRYDTPNKLHSPVYRGNVGRGGEAIFTFDRQFILGHWEKNDRRFALEPLWRMKKGADKNLYVLYDETALVDLGPEVCGTDISVRPKSKVKPEAGGKSVGQCLEVDIALVSDSEMYADFGSVTSVENFMLGVLADVRTLYDDEFPDEILYVLGSTVIYTDTNIDPYTNNTGANILLDNFRSYSNANPSSIPGTFDVACLWTGRNFAGSTVGIAYVPGICSSLYRYNALENFSNSSIQLRNMWAHELGHNFGAPHDASGTSVRHIMYPSVTTANTWSAASINTIEDYYNGLTCLAICTPDVAPTAVADVVYSSICADCSTYFFDMTEARVDSRLWTFPGGNPATSTSASPEVFYDAPGFYEATLQVTNNLGTSTSTVNVRVSATSGTKVLLREDFEDENLRVNFVNPDNDALEFTTISTDGNRGVRAAYADNGTLDGRGSSDFIRTAFIDIDNVENPRLTAQYAYTRWDNFYRDQMRIKVTQGGVETQIFFGDELGNGSFATGPDRSTIGNGLFLPEESNDWCTEGPGCISLNLNRFQGGGPIRIDFENDAGYGQPLYVDNIAVVGTFSAALPVEWVSFDAEAATKSIDLHWTVDQDENNAGFQIERSTISGNDWTVLDFVEATGTSGQSVRYDYIDAAVLPGETYHYRLRQQDIDGQESVSVIRTVSLSTYTVSISAYPNPTTGSVFVTHGAASLPYEIFNGLGQRVATGTLGSGTSPIELGNLPTGVYTIRSEEGSVRVIRK